jgi:ABC-type glycerol-3-phosphate transport system substrate-binding protein
MYYNKSLLGTGAGTVAPVPANWETFVSTAQAAKAAGKTGIAPWSFFHAISLDQWVVQHSLGPTFVNAMLKSDTYKGVDYNNDGILSAGESLRAVKAGKFNPADNAYMQEMLKQAKRYFTDALSNGWDQTDYGNAWTQGTVAMKEEGLWTLANENANIGRTFEYGIIPIPFADNATSSLLPTIEYTEKGPYQPDVDLCLNIMKPAVEGKPEVLAAAIKFLKYLTLPDNIAMMCEEQGASLGAVKGSQNAYSALIEEWLDQRFPKMEKATWPMAFTGEANSKLNRAFAEWVSGSSADNAFFAKVNEAQQEGADTYIDKMGVDTSGW